MKFSVSSTTIHEVLSLVSPGVSSRPTKPILANVKMDADMSLGIIRLTAMNDSMAISAQFDAVILEAGSMCVPKKKLSDLLGTFAGEILDFESEDFILKVINGRSSYKINAMSSDDFPAFPVDKDTEPFEFPASDLFDGLRLASTTASTDETKQVLCGVHIKSGDGKIEFASTDGHRLTVINFYCETPQASEFTLPSSAVSAINRLLAHNGTSGDVVLNLGSNVISAEIGTTSIAVRLLEGQYPNYRQLIPAASAMPFQVVLPAKAMDKTLNRMAVLGNEKTFIVSMDFAGNEVTITAKDAEASEGAEVLTLPDAVSQELSIAFNGHYLRQAIKNAGTTNVRLLAKSPTSPVVVYPDDSDQVEGLVMPIQVRK